MRGGAFFNGKEGRDDFRTKAQAPLADQKLWQSYSVASYIPCPYAKGFCPLQGEPKGS